MSPAVRWLAAIMGTVVLLAFLSLVIFNKHTPHMRMRALMRDGRTAALNADYEEAAEAYRLAISLNKRKPQPYLLLAEAYMAGGSYEDFEDALYFLRLGMRETGNEEIRIAYNDLLGKMAVADEENND
jgi:hypothetical protein